MDSGAAPAQWDKQQGPPTVAEQAAVAAAETEEAAGEEYLGYLDVEAEMERKAGKVAAGKVAAGAAA